MEPIEPLPSLRDFAPLCEAIRPGAFVALVCARELGELSTYRSTDGRWYVWLETRQQRLPLAAWAIEWATHRAIAGAS